MQVGRPQGVTAIAQRQQHVPTDREDHGLRARIRTNGIWPPVFDAENRGLRLFRTYDGVFCSVTFAPLGDRLDVDPIPVRKNSQAFLTILYCATNRAVLGGHKMNCGHQ